MIGGGVFRFHTMGGVGVSNSRSHHLGQCAEAALTLKHATESEGDDGEGGGERKELQHHDDLPSQCWLMMPT
jgi:hypothetical protein